jgi:predicted lactoylglutathione lyase/uncharacterized damage-inducible protein DinB
MTAPERDDSLDRPLWAKRKFLFVHPPWMLADFVERLRGVVPRLVPLLEGVDEATARRQIDGKWSIAQNVGHLSDVEELWQVRLDDLRQGRDAYTPADASHFQSLAQRHHERALPETVAELAERRARLVEALSSAPADLQRASALHPRLQCRMRLVDCAQFYAEHDDHHLLRIRELLNAFRSKAPSTSLEGAVPILRVRDLASSVDYYLRMLGFRLDWSHEKTMASVSRDRVSLMLCQGDQGNPRTWVWIGVEDAAALHDELRAKGATVRLPPTNYPWAYEMHVEDPDGHVLRMGSEPREDLPVSEWVLWYGSRV